MDNDHASSADLTALRAEFGPTTSEPGFVGRIMHRAAARPLFESV
ncbi:hypothetical protein [Streptomyces sp. Tu 2975]|nr:hypothetical protein [Streptomyces sp. Tu 2975]